MEELPKTHNIHTHHYWYINHTRIAAHQVPDAHLKRWPHVHLHRTCIVKGDDQILGLKSDRSSQIACVKRPDFCFTIIMIITFGRGTIDYSLAFCSPDLIRDHWRYM